MFKLPNAIFDARTVHQQSERTDSGIYLLWNLFWSEEKEVKVDRVVFQIDWFLHETSVFEYLVAADGWVAILPHCDRLHAEESKNQCFQK